MRKSISLLSILMFFAFSTTYSQGSFKVTKLDKAQLPKGIKYSGTLKEAIRWTDKLGDNIVIEVESGIFKSPRFKNAELFALHYLLKDSLLLTWKVYDFIRDCEFDVEANFIKNTLQATDLNNDGIAEIWVMFKTMAL